MATGLVGEMYDDELDVERAAMIARLRAMNLGDEDLQRHAVVELARRLNRWRGLPVVHGIPGPDGRDRLASGMELLIVRAVSLRQPPTFGVTSDGAVFTTNAPRGSSAGRQIFITGLSPALDQAAQIYRLLTHGQGGYFRERAGQFIAEPPTDGQKAFGFVGTSSAKKRQRFRDRVGARLERGRALFRRERRDDAPPPTLVVLFQAGPWPPEGVLSEMGYRVGKAGVPTDERRKILRDVMSVELVPASPSAEDYVDQWGSPASVERFTKLYGCLTKFIDLAQRKTHADMSKALADWRADVLWVDNNLNPQHS